MSTSAAVSPSRRVFGNRSYRSLQWGIQIPDLPRGGATLCCRAREPMSASVLEAKDPGTGYPTEKRGPPIESGGPVAVRVPVYKKLRRQDSNLRHGG